MSTRSTSCSGTRNPSCSRSDPVGGADGAPGADVAGTGTVTGAPLGAGTRNDEEERDTAGSGSRALASNGRRRRASSRQRSLGRNLPAAIAVSAVLVALLLASLYIEPSVFVGLAAVAALLAVSELVQAFASRG